ncbi:MAG TPA: RNA polymerase sigma factor [Thermoanaerobaculia bacterium]|nr:RNA polymerase sigma factor [Thermoanaerobaculia bacterium]
MDPSIAMPVCELEPRGAMMRVEAAELEDPEREALAALDRADRDAALTVLMQLYGAPLYRYCRRMVDDEELAQDAHQLTFVQAYEAMAGFSRRSSLRTWLFGIARHRCLDAIKIERRRRRRFARLDEEEDRPAAGVDPEAGLAAGSLGAGLGACLRGLTPRVRAAVLLRFQQGLSYVQIAALTGERAPALQARVARALPVLRRCLEQRGLAP